MKKRKHLETCVKERFGSDLCRFLKDMVEKELLYDREIGKILNVDPGYAGKLRSSFGIRKSNAFSRRFERTYGPGAEETFRTMIENPDVSLSEVGRFFGFSREYARQVYEKIYGFSYTAAHRRKREERKRKREMPKHPAKFMRIREKLVSMGLSTKIENEGRLYTILANGYRLSLKSCGSPAIIGRKRYFHFTFKNCPGAEDCDFFVCVLRAEGEETHFIIPQDVMPGCSLALSPEASEGRSKYSQFKEAWHLLNRSKEDLVSCREY